jgi:hypothetical protein
MQQAVDAVSALLVISRALEGQYTVVVLLQPLSQDTYHIGVLSEYDISESKLVLPDGLGLVRTNDEHGFVVGVAEGSPLVTVSQLFEDEGYYTVPRLGAAEPRALYPLVQTTVLNAVFDAPKEQCVQTPVEETYTNNNGADLRCPPS